MGCAQAKPGHPNTTNKNHQTNHLSSTPNQGHTREVIKTKNHSNDPLLQQGHQQHVKQNRQKSHNLLIQQKDNIKQLEQNSHSNNKNSNKKTGLQQLLDSQGNRKQQKSLSQSLSKSKSKGRNPMNLIQNDISPIQIRVRNENDQEENEDEFDTNSDNGQNDVKNNLNQSKQKNTVKNNNNNNLQLQKNMRKKDNNNQQQQNIDDICLGVESKVEDQYKNNNKNNNNTNNNKNNKNNNNNNKNNNNKTVQQIKTKLLTQSQKNISDNLNKKPFNHNLFYSQHHVAVKDQINGQSPNKTNKINREQMNYTTKENKNTTKSLRKQTNEEEYGSYFEENHNNNNNKNTHLNNDSKSVKSQLPNKNDFSLLQENSQQKTSKTMTNFNKKKLNQFHSVIENKQKLLEDKAKEIKVKKSQQKQENIDDYLIQEHDQQGSVRAPLETSYHAPSKRTIQQQKLSSSKKDISLSSQSLSRSKKPTLKYIAQLNNPAITERPSQMEKQDNQLEERKSLQQIQHLRKQSKLETAFFKTSSSKQMLQAQTDHKNLIQQQQLKLSMGKKKTGPILFSQISFKDKDDSDYVPQEGSYVNGLQMSVHLNIAQHF